MIYWEDNGFYSEERPYGFNFSNHYGGPTVWEGVRSYQLNDNKYHAVFLKAHMERLLRSAKALNVSTNYTADQLCKAARDVINEYEDKNIYLRPVIYVSRSAEGVSQKAVEEYSVAIYPTPTKDLGIPKDGIKVGISTYRRGYPEFQMQIKNASNYLMGQMAKHEMDRQNFDDALLQDGNGYITEAIVANLFIIKDGHFITPPSDGSILEGITRKWVIEQSGYKVVEKYITRHDIYTADAAFITGTFVEFNWIKQVDHVLFDKHPLFVALHEKYKDFIQGGVS